MAGPDREWACSDEVRRERNPGDQVSPKEKRPFEPWR